MSAVDLYAAATHEWDEWHALESLSGPPRPFSEAEEAQARATLARAVGHAATVRFIAKNTVDRIEGTHLLGGKALAAAIEQGGHLRQSMCQPIVVDSG